MAEQTSISYYQTEFKFNGKELDNETGMYYYGARYYDPSLSIWMSVDPLAEQFPNFSPYNYTMNNPINMIDPDGRAAEWVPSVDEYGCVSYIAEEGDSAKSLASQYGLSQKDAEAITDTNGSEKIEKGTALSGDKVAGVTKNEVLKLHETRDTQKNAEQLMFALEHSASSDEGKFQTKDYFAISTYQSATIRFDGIVDVGETKMRIFGSIRGYNTLNASVLGCKSGGCDYTPFAYSSSPFDYNKSNPLRPELGSVKLYEYTYYDGSHSNVQGYQRTWSKYTNITTSTKDVATLFNYLSSL